VSGGFSRQVTVQPTTRYARTGSVNIGSRVAGLAGPGEVLASSTVKDLVSGSGIVFEDRGAHSLKGIPGEWRVFKVAGV